MMRGTKRSATSDITSGFNFNDSVQSKRVVVGSTFEGRRADSSAFPQPLDTQRAESSRQHVKALNNQFASWVQTQLTNHPDELWEDGVQDYLNHAKGIMEKFSDVVNWLKENSAKGDSFRELRSNDNVVKPTSEIDKDNHKSLFSKPEFPPAAKLRSNDNVVKPTSEINKDNPKSPFSKPEFTPAANLCSGNVVKPTSEIDKDNHSSFFSKPAFSSAATPSFGTSNIFNSNSPFSFGGNQFSTPGNINTVPSNHDVSNEADGEGDVEQPSSPSVKKSEEKGICVVHEVKCKLYVKSTDPADKDAWKDKGMGQLTIKCKEGVSKGSKESKPNIVIRNDVGKVVLNALLYSGIKTNKQKNSIVAIFHTSDDNDNNDKVVARTFLMKTKTEEDRDKLADAIHKYAPVS